MLGFLSPGVDGGTRRGGRRSLPAPVHLAWDGTTWPLPPSGICVLRNSALMGVGFWPSCPSLGNNRIPRVEARWLGPKPHPQLRQVHPLLKQDYRVVSAFPAANLLVLGAITKADSWALRAPWKEIQHQWPMRYL